MVEFAVPNQELFAAADARMEELRKEKQDRESRKFVKFNYFKVDMPDRPKIGDKASKAIFILPSMDPTKLNYVERVKRFYKSAKFPKGASICCGYDSILQKSLDMFRRETGERHTFFSGSRKFIYQGFPLIVDAKFQLFLDVEGCVVKDQEGISPQIFEAPASVHESITNVINMVGGGDPSVGYQRCFFPQSGVPFLISKEKTGGEMMNVRYSVERMEAMPLPEHYMAGLDNMYDLDAIYPEATIEEQIEIIRDHSLPIPPEALELGATRGTQALGVPQPQQPKPVSSGNPLMAPKQTMSAPKPMPVVAPSPYSPPAAVPPAAKPIDAKAMAAKMVDDVAAPAAYDPSVPLTEEGLEAIHKKGPGSGAPF